MNKIKNLESKANETCIRTSTSFDALNFDELTNIYGGKNESTEVDEQEDLTGLGSGGFLCWC